MYINYVWDWTGNTNCGTRTLVKVNLDAAKNTFRKKIFRIRYFSISISTNKVLTWKALLATRQTDVSTSVIQIPATPTTSIIPNRREIRDWVIVDRQIGSFYEVRVNSREGKWPWNYFISVSHHKCIEYICFHVKWYI